MSTTTFIQTETATTGTLAGDFLWSDPANWTNGLPVDGETVTTDTLGFDNIASLTLATLNEAAAGEVYVTGGVLNIGTVIGGQPPMGTIELLQFAQVFADSEDGGAPVIVTIGSLVGYGGYGAIGVGATLVDDSPTDPGASYFERDGGTLVLATAPAQDAELSYLDSGTLAIPGTIELEHLNLVTSAELQGVQPGDDPVRVVQIIVVCSIANQAAMSWLGRHDIDWRGLGAFLGGGVLGLPIGIALLLHADHAVYTLTLGFFLLAYGACMLVRKPGVIRRRNPLVDAVVGFGGGVTGGSSGLPGIPVTIWCGTKGWDKSRQRAMFQPFILVMQIATVVGISLARHPQAGGPAFDVGDLLFVPASLLGITLGLRLYRRFSDGQFARAVNVMLMMSGASFVV